MKKNETTESFRRGMAEALAGQTQPIETLWDDIDEEDIRADLQRRLDAAIAALMLQARTHYSFQRWRGYTPDDPEVENRIFHDYEGETFALFDVLKAEGVIEEKDDEDDEYGGYVFVSRFPVGHAADEGQGPRPQP